MSNKLLSHACLTDAITGRGKETYHPFRHALANEGSLEMDKAHTCKKINYKIKAAIFVIFQLCI